MLLSGLGYYSLGQTRAKPRRTSTALDQGCLGSVVGGIPPQSRLPWPKAQSDISLISLWLGPKPEKALRMASRCAYDLWYEVICSRGQNSCCLSAQASQGYIAGLYPFPRLATTILWDFDMEIFPCGHRVFTSLFASQSCSPASGGWGSNSYVTVIL